MSNQYNKVEKRARRTAYVKRKKADTLAAKAAVKAKQEAEGVKAAELAKPAAG